MTVIPDRRRSAHQFDAGGPQRLSDNCWMKHDVVPSHVT